MKTILRITALSVVLLMLAGGFVSCVRETEQLDILIQNRTENPIHVIVFPKEELLRADLYTKCFGCGGANYTNFRLYPYNSHLSSTWDETIFFTPDLSIKPHTLALQAFDSIHIELTTIDSADIVLKFTPESVVGYSKNIFSENSAWDFRIWRSDMQMQMSRTEIKHHQHIFVISNDKIVTNNP
ncbi:MAG: hypothetical protein FWD02_04285 [Bacteroidales bacterium]|nr:hypothetical protein [Bacteroidales bacterium]